MRNGGPVRLNRRRSRVNSLLVAAGLSKRMGKFKPLLLYKNRPIIITVIEKLKDISNKTFIVTGFRDGDLVSEIKKYFDKESEDKIVFVSNPEFEKGMFVSLQAGLKKAKECDWLLYHFVDQPHLPPKFYSEFVSKIDDKYDWIQPAFNERKGHPVLIKNSLFKILIEAGENSSLKELTNGKKVNKKIWNCNYSEILNDLDTPQDYEELIKGTI